MIITRIHKNTHSIMCARSDSCPERSVCAQIHRQVYGGFILAEILVSMAIISFVIVPLTVFVIHKSDIRSYTNSIWDSDSYVRFGIRANELFEFHNIDNYSSKKSCDVFFSTFDARLRNEYLNIESQNIAQHASNAGNLFNRIVKNTQQQIIDHVRNIPSAIEVIQVDPYNSYLYIGVNSASTTDPDLYVINDRGNGNSIKSKSSENLEVVQSRFINQSSHNLGPGIVDMVRNKNTIALVEKSVVIPIRIIVTKNGLINKFLNITGEKINYAYPKIIEIRDTYLLIGTEKNINQELYVLNINKNDSMLPSANSNGLIFQNFSAGALISGAEIGSGVNDIEIMDKYIIIANAKDPEFLFYSIDDLGIKNGDISNEHTYTDNLIHKNMSNSTIIANSVEPQFSYDAPGSSGNGKSIYSMLQHVVFGRTLGNHELLIARLMYVPLVDRIKFHNQDTNLNTTIKSKIVSLFQLTPRIHESINLNISIQHIQSMLNGMYLMVFTNKTEASIVIFKKIRSDNSFAYREITRIPTTSEIIDFDCTTSSIYMIQKSTSTQLILFEI